MDETGFSIRLNKLASPNYNFKYPTHFKENYAPVKFLRALAGPERTRENNRSLDCSLAFVAGAVNAGRFLAAGQYTSHMSGIVSALADDTALRKTTLVSTLPPFAPGKFCKQVQPGAVQKIDRLQGLIGGNDASLLSFILLVAYCPLTVESFFGFY